MKQRKTTESWEIIMNYRRMRHIRRANNFPTIHTEDVAQHSYFTTMLAMLFKDECDKFGENNLNDSSLLRKCLLHDTEESFTSDIPYPIKHMSHVISRELELKTNQSMSKLVGFDDIQNRWNKIRHNSKSELEGTVVAFCDMLELSLYSYEEIAMGNRAMTVMLDNCNKYLTNLLNHALDSVFTGCPEHPSVVVPTIWKLVELVQRDPSTNSFIIQDYVTDIS